MFLLDEPLSNLDAKLRAQMRTEISKLHARLATTFIYVTHDQIEAMTMGTRIVVMKDGFMQQVDTPQNLYDYPINLFVAGFIGTPQMNFFPATLTKQNGRVYVEFVNNKILLPKSVEVRIQNIDDYLDTGKAVTLGVRPEDIHDEENFISASPDTVIKAFVEVVEKLGAETQIYCKLDFKEGEQIEDATTSSAVPPTWSRRSIRAATSAAARSWSLPSTRAISISSTARRRCPSSRVTKGMRSRRERGVLRIRAADPAGDARDHREEQSHHQGREEGDAP